MWERQFSLSVSLNVIEWHLLSHATIRFSHFLVHGISPFFNIWSSSKNSFNPMLCLKAFPIDYSRLLLPFTQFSGSSWWIFNFAIFLTIWPIFFILKPYELLKRVKHRQERSFFLQRSGIPESMWEKYKKFITSNSSWFQPSKFNLSLD